MKQQIISEVVQQMLPHLDNAQMQQLQKVLENALFGCKITAQTEKKDTDDNPKLIDAFVSAKRIEGCSEKTLKYYRTTIETMVASIDKGIRHIQTEDLRSYLTDYQSKNQSSRVTIDNIRRILSSFFSWLEDEDYILKSPVRRIHKVKTATNIKETYTDEDLEKMRDNCTELRDLAMIDMLASTGMRIGEMVLLNKADINFNERECVVFGKGDKERIVYFDARTKIHLQNYIDSRTDDNPALFVTLRSPHERIKIGGIESRLREMGKQLDIPKVHPHKFRRTLATMAIDKGMPIEQLQQLLGHKRMSDRPFLAKMDMPGGFKESALRLNKYVVLQNEWNEKHIQERANELAKKAEAIWPYPTLTAAELAPYQAEEKTVQKYSLESYDVNAFTRMLFESLDKRIMNLSPAVKKEYKKLYVAYKLDTNFVDIVFQKQRLRISINMKFSEINDPNGICKDITGLGRWGNGDVELFMEHQDELDQIMEIVKQSYDAQAE